LILRRTFDIAIALAALMLGSACATTPRGPLVADGVRNYEKVDEKLQRGAQPTVAGVNKLADLGVTTIIDLRSPYESRTRFDDERATASARTLHFKTIPVSNWLAPPEADVLQILQIIDDPASDVVFVHCQRGADRTGTIVAIYRIMHDCRSAEEAIREARDHGMAWWQFPMRRFIRAWDRTRRPDRCKALTTMPSG
jgi:tyrosine-protein phosphatase SIW14